MQIGAHHAQVVKEYLERAQTSTAAALEALADGDADALADHLADVVHAARQAEARAEQATMMAEGKAVFD